MRDENDREIQTEEKDMKVTTIMNKHLFLFFLAADIDINSHKHNTDTLSSKMSQEKYFFCINALVLLNK